MTLASLRASFFLFTLFFVDFFDDAGRISGHDGIGRDVAGYHRAGSDHGSVAHGDARQDGGAPADPHAVADGDGLGPLDAGVAGLGLQWMAGGVDAHVRADEYMVAETDHGFVQDGEVEVGEETVADLDVAAVVTAEGRVDVYVPAATSQDGAQQGLAPRLVLGRHGVEKMDAPAVIGQPPDKFGVKGIINLALEHFLPFLFKIAHNPRV